MKRSVVKVLNVRLDFPKSSLRLLSGQAKKCFFLLKTEPISLNSLSNCYELNLLSLSERELSFLNKLLVKMR